jgi:hypothetical protein
MFPENKKTFSQKIVPFLFSRCHFSLEIKKRRL